MRSHAVRAMRPTSFGRETSVLTAAATIPTPDSQRRTSSWRLPADIAVTPPLWDSTPSRSEPVDLHSDCQCGAGHADTGSRGKASDDRGATWRDGAHSERSWLAARWAG